MKTKLERLREIEYNIKQFDFFGSEITKRIVLKYKKEAQEIKDNWKDGCGIEILKSNNKPIYCGEMFFGKIRFCNNCLKQNKEKDEIFGRILG